VKLLIKVKRSELKQAYREKQLSAGVAGKAAPAAAAGTKED